MLPLYQLSALFALSQKALINLNCRVLQCLYGDVFTQSQRINPLYYKALVSKLTATIDQVDLHMYPDSGGQWAHHATLQQFWTRYLAIWLRNKPTVGSREILGIVRSDISGDAWWTSRNVIIVSGWLWQMQITELSLTTISNQTIVVVGIYITGSTCMWSLGHEKKAVQTENVFCVFQL